MAVLGPRVARGERLLRLEHLEARRLPSLGEAVYVKGFDPTPEPTPLIENPVRLADDAVGPSWVNAVDDVANLANYSAEELASAGLAGAKTFLFAAQKNACNPCFGMENLGTTGGWARSPDVPRCDCAAGRS